ncbi:MAG: BON domain-containing protein [Candidatus Manganitrophus sp.]|nr:BON domain-containing protein [Candidatus Manganitrophus sp.]
MKETLSKLLIFILLIGATTGCATWREHDTESAPTDRGAGTTTQTDDAALTAKVKAKLLSDDVLNGMNIDVDTQNGVVFLNGVVDSPRTRSGRRSSWPGPRKGSGRSKTI